MYARRLRMCPRKILKIVCFEIDFDGIFTYKNSQVFINLLNFRLK